VTGGDLMDLEDDDLTSDLGLSRLQVPRSLSPAHRMSPGCTGQD